MNSGSARPSATTGYAMKRARPLLGTLVEIAAHGATEAEANQAISQAFAAVETIQSLMAYHDPASDVSRLNRAGAGCIRVDPHTWHVLDVARTVSEASDGVFDVSIAPELVRLGYLPDHTDFSHPAADANWQHIELLSDQRVRLVRPLHLDLGGIAKGYAVDCAIRTLQEAGMVSGRVNAGGDLRLFGVTAETIHVRHPHYATQLMPLCTLTEGAIATSALYYSGRQVDGRPVSPLINARTRNACVESSSVSVLADHCIVADALTKVVFAHPERALAVLTQFGAHAVVLDIAPDQTPANLSGRSRVRHSGPDGWHLATASEQEAAAA